MNKKTCGNCKSEKFYGEFFKDSSRPCGVASVCKLCHMNGVRRRAKQRGQALKNKTCRNCEETHDISSYSRSTCSTDGFDPLCKKCRSIRNKIRRSKSRASILVTSARDRCIKNGIPFDLSSYVREIQARIDTGVCEISGMSLDHTPGRKFHTPSVDRIEPSIGYIYSNIRIVCLGINVAMNDWGEEATFAAMKQWVENKSKTASGQQSC